MLIVDFLAGTDRIEVSAADFGGGLTEGALDPDAFVSNGTGRAEDAEDRFIYRTNNGQLYYDADGTGAGGAIVIARFKNLAAPSASDFVVVSGSETAPPAGSATQATIAGPWIDSGACAAEWMIA